SRDWSSDVCSSDLGAGLACRGSVSLGVGMPLLRAFCELGVRSCRGAGPCRHAVNTSLGLVDMIRPRWTAEVSEMQEQFSDPDIKRSYQQRPNATAETPSG